MTGVAVGWGTDFERGVARQAFLADTAREALAHAAQPSLSPFEDRAWRAAQPGLARVFEQHKKWQAEPVIYEAARNRWHVALTLELRVAAATTTGTETWRFFSP